MTKRLFDTDSYLLEFEACVLCCNACETGYEILLDATAFCPEGGGQPSDIGSLEGTVVLDVRERKGEIWHLTKQPLPIDQRVRGTVDAARRLRHMQNHTGEHIVTGIFHNNYHLNNIGFHLGHEDVTLDLDGDVDTATLRLVEWLANNIVAENRSVLAYYPSPEALSALPYRAKGEIEGAVRIVEIEGHDRCACCVPHVKQTGEVGGIRLLSAMRYKGGTRIHMKCGLDAIADANTDADRIAALSHLLSLPGERLFDGVKKLNDDLAAARFELTALRRAIADEHADAIEISEKWICLFEHSLTLPELRRMAERLLARGAIRLMLCTPNQQEGYDFVFADTSESFDENAKALRAALPIRGGGKPPFLQGSLVAEKEYILSHFNT